jgi:hypothetical protein
MCNVGRVSIASFLVLLALLATPQPIFAQTRAAGTPDQRFESRMTRHTSAFDFDADRFFRSAPDFRFRQQPDQPRRRDSLKNGAIIGAIVGAAALGTFGGFLCNALQEPGTPSCLGDTLRIAAVGAAIGLGAGLAIDAALMRQPGVGVAVRVKF